MSLKMFGPDDIPGTDDVHGTFNDMFKLPYITWPVVPPEQLENPFWYPLDPLVHDGVVFMNKTMLCQIRSHKHTYTNDFLYTCAYINMHLLNLCEHYQDIYIHWDFFHDQESYDQNHIESIVLLDFF